ncbi:polysaccharide pyruvyl transferase family protein [Virgibacillus oceani]|nr:polysaccharide pyruvyl transferase family protein [Virgibacillus oceani]
MKKVMVYAYTHFNLGDDLFIKVLCEKYPKTIFVLYAPKEYKQTFKEFNNIRLFPSNSIIVRGLNYCFRQFHIYSFFRRLLAKDCDAAVHIGGSLFIQGENWRDELKNTKEMRIPNRPFYLLGANFGPYHDNGFYQEHKELFKGYTDICFREKHSYELFNDLHNVRMADDMIFQLKTPAVQVLHDSIVISVIKPSIRKHLSNYDDVYYRKMRDLAVFFIEKGYTVTLMSFCEYEQDDEAIETITNLIPESYLTKLNKHFYKFNIDETLHLIAASNFVIATRFHSMILGWVFHKPVFPIVYSDKMTNSMQDIGFDGTYTDIKNISALTPEYVFNSIDANLIDVSIQAQNAEKHFERLDEYLLERGDTN